MGVSACLHNNARLGQGIITNAVYYFARNTVTTAHMNNKTVDYYDDPCSRDILRTTVHGVISALKSCDNSTDFADEITDKIVRSVPELNSHDYFVIICPTTPSRPSSDTLKCLYSVHITERRNNLIVTNSYLTRASVAALQSSFTTVSMQLVI